jgi:hypothetical protein
MSGMTSHAKSWGAGLAPQFTFGSSSAPVKLSLAPGFDYLKQEGGGPGSDRTMMLVAC